MRFTRTTTVIAAAGLLLAGGTIGYAAIPSADGSVKLCYAKIGNLVAAKGTARVVDSAEACKSTESAVTVASADALEALKATVAQQATTIRGLEVSRTGLEGRVEALEGRAATLTTSNVQQDGQIAELQKDLATTAPYLDMTVVRIDSQFGGIYYHPLIVGRGLKPGSVVRVVVDTTTTTSFLVPADGRVDRGSAVLFRCTDHPPFTATAQTFTGRTIEVSGLIQTNPCT